MDIESIKAQARSLAFEMMMNVEDVDDTVAARRVRLKSEVTKLVPSAERLGAKGNDDPAEWVNKVIEEVYADAVTRLEPEEEITPKVVVRELTVALDHIKTKTGYIMWHHPIRERATEYFEKQDLPSVVELLKLMPEARKQVVDLRKNYGVRKAGTDKIEWFSAGWAEVLSMMDYIDFCTEFLEREKNRLQSTSLAA